MEQNDPSKEVVDRFRKVRESSVVPWLQNQDDNVAYVRHHSMLNNIAASNQGLPVGRSPRQHGELEARQYIQRSGQKDNHGIPRTPSHPMLHSNNESSHRRSLQSQEQFRTPKSSRNQYVKTPIHNVQNQAAQAQQHFSWQHIQDPLPQQYMQQRLQYQPAGNSSASRPFLSSPPHLRKRPHADDY
ncbi:hypothetical protein BGZ76_006463, partial [Entomortierella beljakovae]